MDLSKRIMARARWIMDNLRAGRHWNTGDLADAFRISISQGKRAIAEFKAVHTDWKIKWDKREQTFFLDSSPKESYIPKNPQKIFTAHPVEKMSGEEFMTVRYRLSMTEAVLAYCLDVHVKTIQRWEKRGRIPDAVAYTMRSWEKARRHGVWDGQRKKVFKKQSGYIIPLEKGEKAAPS